MENSTRVTLKLKAGPRKSPSESKAPRTLPAQSKPAYSKSNVKADAHWSDEYKARMQADMDMLAG